MLLPSGLQRNSSDMRESPADVCASACCMGACVEAETSRLLLLLRHTPLPPGAEPHHLLDPGVLMCETAVGGLTEAQREDPGCRVPGSLPGLHQAPPPRVPGGTDLNTFTTVL